MSNKLEIEEKTKEKEEEEVIWTKVYDATTDSNYYWNEATDETTWDTPAEFQDKEETAQQSKDKLDAEYFKSKEYHDWYYKEYYPSLCTIDYNSINTHRHGTNYSHC